MRPAAFAVGAAAVGVAAGYLFVRWYLRTSLRAAAAPFDDAASRSYAQIRYLSTIGMIPEGEVPAL